MSVRSILLFLFSFALLQAGVAQEGRRIFNPEKFERATKADDKGLTQWDAHKADKCPNCNGTGKTKCGTCARFADDAKNCPECKRTPEREIACRSCAGTGTFPDPLEKVLCPSCDAAAFLLCMVCGGGGQLKVDKAKQWSDCPGCRGAGGFKCTTCNGTRLVEPAALKPSLKEAPVAAIDKAMAATEQAMKELGEFTPAGGDKARKEVKALSKTFDTVGSVYPPLKRMTKALDDYMGKTYNGANFQGHEEHEAHAMLTQKDGALQYLKHQKRMLELAKKRAEANAKAAAEQKGK